MNLNSISEVFLITGSVVSILGFVFYRFPPRKINGLYGYRTLRAMKSQSAWEFAQRKSALIMIRLGLLLLGIGVINLFVDTSHWPGWIASTFLLSFLFIGFGVLFYKVERALRKRFAE